MKKMTVAVMAVMVLMGSVSAEDVMLECAGDHVSGCIEMGNEKWDAKEYQEAISLFDKACNGGITMGCLKKGDVFDDEDWGERDQGKAQKIYAGVFPHASEKCKSGKASECYAVGEMYFFGKFVKDNTQTAATFYKKACDLNDSEGCSTLGELYGNGVLHYDLKKILFYYEKACQLGDFDACTNVEETKALNSDDISSAGENK